MKLTNGLKVGVLALFPIIGIAVMSLAANSRPTSFSIDIEPSPDRLSVLRAIVNGMAVVDSSMRGRLKTGPLNYQSTFGANLAVHVMWYDILDKQFYEKAFDLDVRTFSTFGEEAIHAAVTIVVGPGADVTVTTPHPEVLRLVGLNRMDDITPEIDVPVVLAELCADRLNKDPSEGGILMSSSTNKASLANEMEQRDNWLRQNQAQPARCVGGKSN